MGPGRGRAVSRRRWPFRRWGTGWRCRRCRCGCCTRCASWCAQVRRGVHAAFLLRPAASTAPREGPCAHRRQAHRIRRAREAANLLLTAGPRRHAAELDEVLVALQRIAPARRADVAELPLGLELRIARQEVQPADGAPVPVVSAEHVREGVARAGAHPQAREPLDVALPRSRPARDGQRRLDALVAVVLGEEALHVPRAHAHVRARRAQVQHLAVQCRQRRQLAEQGLRVTRRRAAGGGLPVRARRRRTRGGELDVAAAALLVGGFSGRAGEAGLLLRPAPGLLRGVGPVRFREDCCVRGSGYRGLRCALAQHPALRRGTAQFAPRAVGAALLQERVRRARLHREDHLLGLGLLHRVHAGVRDEGSRACQDGKGGEEAEGKEGEGRTHGARESTASHRTLGRSAPGDRVGAWDGPSLPGIQPGSSRSRRPTGASCGA